ncbi:MAG: SOS response-associated peptidase family protein [Campylobacterota bacterium]|nr:SOS response-associated peptidase family protein [Campylobacterota bacterium]
MFTYFIFYSNFWNKNIKLSGLFCWGHYNDKIKEIHDRMPVILEKKDWASWLDNGTSFEELNSLFKPYPNDKIKIEEVNKLVNSVKNDSIDCISKPIEVKLGQGSLF